MAALLLESVGPLDPARWKGRFGAVGVRMGVALFSVVFGSNWQARYLFGIPYFLLWGPIVAIPVGSAGFAVRAVRRTMRTTARLPS